MKLSAILFSVSLLASGTLSALPPLPATRPPFESSEKESVRNTRFIPGKGLCRFQGEAAQVICYKSGTPQLHFRSPDRRFGGIAIQVDGKDVKGTRREDGQKIIYDFPGSGTLSIALRPDGKVQFEARFPQAEKKLQINFFLRGVEFGGTRFKIDAREFTLPPFVDKTLKADRMFSGGARAIRLCAGQPEKSFTVEPESGKTEFINVPAAPAAFLQLVADDPRKPFRFVLDPGAKAGTALPPPAGRVTKAANCDLWALDRYSLPDQSGKNLLQNSSFEQGLRYMIFRHRGKVNFNIFDSKPVFISDKEAKFGTHSLAIRSTPDGLLHQPVSTHTLLFGPGTCTLSFYAKTDKPGKQTLTVQFMDPALIWDSSKWPAVKIPLTGEWKRYTLTHTWKSSAAFPVVFSARSAADATCYIDGVQLEKGAKATPYEVPLAEGALRTSAPDNFIEYGKPVDAHLDIVTAPDAKGTVAVKVRDFFDTVKLQKTFSFTADAQGKARVDLPLNGLPRGIFIVESDYTIGGKKRYEIQRFSIMSFLDNTHKHKNMFVNTYVDPLFPMQIYRDVLDRYRKIGYGARSGFVINDERLAQLADSFGVESSICRIAHARKDKNGRNVEILREVEWYLIPGRRKSDSLLVENATQKEIIPELLKRVEDAAAEIAKNSPSVRGWYFLCEPEGTLPEWANPAYAKPEEYRKFIALETAVAKGVKRGNPKAELYTSPTSNIASPDRILFYDRLFAEAAKNGIRYDAVAAHNYRVGAPEYPVSMERQYKNLFAVLDKHGYSNVKISSPEGMHWLPVRCLKSPFISDYPISSGHLNGLVPYTYDLSYAEKIGSAYRARSWLVGLKHQDRIRQMNASNYGAFEMDAMLTPFAFQKIPNTLGRLLGNARFLEELNLFPNTRCYLFEDEQKRPVAAIWACMEEVDLGEAAAPDFLFKPAAGLELFDLMEAEHALPADKNGETVLPLSPYPVFLRGKPDTAKEFAAMLRAGHGRSNIAQRPLLTVRLNSASDVAVRLENIENSTLSGTLLSPRGDRKVSIPAGGSTDFTLPLPIPLSADKQTAYDLTLRFRKQDGKNEVFRYDRSFAGLLAKRAEQPIVIDGNPAKWAAYPAIPMTTRFRGKFLQRRGLFPDAKDFSADYKIAWDENGLYLAVFVKDDKFVWKKQPRIKDGWKNDSLQVFFDTFADGGDSDRKRTIGSDDWSYGIYPQNASASELAVWRYLTPDVQLTRGVAGAKADTLADDVKAAFRKTADGYFYEVAFSPKSVEPFRLKAGNTLGIGILLNDADDPSQQEPRSRLTNTTGTDMPNERPDFWPLVRLTE